MVISFISDPQNYFFSLVDLCLCVPDMSSFSSLFNSNHLFPYVLQCDAKTIPTNHSLNI